VLSQIWENFDFAAAGGTDELPTRISHKLDYYSIYYII